MLGLFKNILPQFTIQRQICLSKLVNYSTDIVPNEKMVNVEHEVNVSNQENEKDKLYSRLEIELNGVDPAVLKSYSWFATTSAEHLGIQVGNCWAMRKAKHDRLTLLKSVHIYKKHRVQYEIRTYFRYMHFHKLTGSTLSTFLEYIERNLPEGVGLKATKYELQKLPDHLHEPPPKDDS